jgi:hypothetical protein
LVWLWLVRLCADSVVLEFKYWIVRGAALRTAREHALTCGAIGRVARFGTHSEQDEVGGFDVAVGL